jgi:thiamine biosynthesis lipoprotein ApbE
MRRSAHQGTTSASSSGRPPLPPHHRSRPRRAASAARSVTIVSDRAVLADALSTGVFVLGPAKGMALIERLPQVEGVIVTAENDVLVSSGLKDTVRIISTRTSTKRP